MPRPPILCLTIVAAFQLHPAAAQSISEDAPVTESVAAVARTLGIDPARDPARFLTELTRLLYTPPVGKNAAVGLLFRSDPGGQTNGFEDVRVPVPLSAAVWSQAVFRRTVTSEQLVGAIAADRRAALLAHGLAALDDETLAFLGREPGILTRLYERGTSAFAVFGASVRIRGKRVVPPGGDEAVPLWEAVVGQSVQSPDRFLRAVFGEHEGRLAYLYDTIAQLDSPRAAFALGTWIADNTVRVERFRALAAFCIETYNEWHLDTLPFSKPLHDLAMLLMRARVMPSGAPAAPASRAFWEEAFNSRELSVDNADLPADPSASGLIDAAWLAGASAGDLYWRGDRLDQFAFGQRVFASARPELWRDVLVAVRAFPRQRMLMLTLERMGITTPAVYAQAARYADRVAGGDPARAFWRLAQMQSAIALVSRMAVVGTLDAAAAESLILSLCSVPIVDGRYSGAIVEWLERRLLPLLRESTTVEEAVISGLAGPSPGPEAPFVAWEGQEYRLDFSFAEVRRLRIVRERQAGYSLDLAVGLHRVAGMVASARLTADDVRRAAETLSTFREAFAPRFGRRASDVYAPGVQSPRDARETLNDAIADLTKIAAGREPRRAARLSPPLLELVDIVLGSSLLSMAYAVDIGDPDGTAMLATYVALRHDFGFGRQDAEIRSRTPWSIPRQDFQPGVPWHISGSVLGLDIALAPLALRRLTIDRVADAPRLSSTERDAFAVGLSLLNPRLLRDADRDAIAAAIALGRKRIAALAAGLDAFEPLADEIALDGWRRRAIRWMIDNDPAGVPSTFSLVELMTLGGASGPGYDAWGTTSLVLEACACTRLVPPRVWRLLSGRPQLGMMASAMADLNLHVAVTLAELRLPAALARPVLASAVLEFIEEAMPSDANDWWTLTRTAQKVPRQRIEDYIAAAAAVDGPLVPTESEDAAAPPDLFELLEQ